MIPPIEFRQRRERASAAAEARGLDALLVWGRGGSLDAFSDVLYFSNHYSPMVWVPPLAGVLTGCEHAALLIVEGEATLLVSDFTSVDVHVEEVRKAWDLTSELVTVLREGGASGWKVGVIGQEVLPFDVARALQEALPSVSLVPADDISAMLRLRLSEAEVALLVRAGAVGRTVYGAFLEQVVEGATEGEAVGASLQVAARIPGCMHWNYISASGPDADVLVRRSIPPWNVERRFSAGDIVHADCFGYVDGYCYDLARTVAIPGPGQRRKEDVARRTRQVVGDLAAALRPGVTCGGLHQVGARSLEQHALSARLGSFGHGIGAGFFRPYLVPVGPDLDRQLEPPCGISIEVFATDGDGRYAYHEDNFVILDDRTLCVTEGL